MIQACFVKTLINQQDTAKHLPILSSQNQNWESILVNQFRYPSGEATCYFEHEHVIYLSLASRPVHFLHIKEGKTYTGFCKKGSMAIIPAKMPLFTQWNDENDFLEIRMTSPFMERVAGETLNKSLNRIELLLGFRIYDPQLEAIAMLLLVELQQKNSGSGLYIESLSNVLAVYLLRNYATMKVDIPIYRGGLPQHQLVQVLDYINDYLHQDIKLANLAALLNMSQYHLSHQFKQATGITPYQYLLQQRIERAKQLLKQNNRPIADIALACGFNSHSHLSKQFRQLTGTTPKAYRSHWS